MSDNQQSMFGRVAGRLTGRALDVVDPQIVLDHIDIEAVLDRIDVNRVLDRIDANRLLDRVDIDRVLARIDMEKLLAGVDLESLVRRSGVPDIVAESTGRMAGSALDVGRRQLAGLDTIIDQLVDRVLRRPRDARPVSPPLLQGIAP
jgi:hypothetical protein